jgi:hypothetical protein
VNGRARIALALHRIVLSLVRCIAIGLVACIQWSTTEGIANATSLSASSRGDKPPPPPCSAGEPLKASVIVHYWGTSLERNPPMPAPGSCEFTSDVPDFASRVALGFDDAGITVSFRFFQPTLRYRRNFFHQDNAKLRILWQAGGLAPAVATTTLSTAVASNQRTITVQDITGAHVGGQVQLYAPSGSLTTAIVTAIHANTIRLRHPLPRAFDAGDTVEFPPNFLNLLVTAYGECKVLSPSVDPAKMDSCSVVMTHYWSAAICKDGCNNKSWQGSLKVPYTLLRQHNVSSTFGIEIIRDYYPNAQPGAKRAACPSGGPSLFDLCETASFDQPMLVDYKTADLNGDRYLSGGPDFGNENPAPPHRTVLNGYFPLSVSTLAAATLSDDAGPPLSIRDEAVKASVSDEQAKKVACHSCGSFQADDQQPFTQALTSKTVLGVDFSQLGLDNLPFSFNAASYPIDSGYKLISGKLMQFAAASFRGTTTSNGVASDNVLLLQAPVKAGGTALYVGLYNVDASRSHLASTNDAVYSPFIVNELHSANTQGTVAFNTYFQDDDRALSGITTRPTTAVSGILRYGTQYGPHASDFDIAASVQDDPPLLNLFSTKEETWHFSGAAGYRNVGPTYVPIDAPLDTHIGEHGFYGIVDYTGTASKARPYDVSLSMRRFSDSFEARDVSAGVDINVPLSSVISVKASYATASLAVSQVARQSKFIVPDSRGGGSYLPNGHLSGSFVFAPPGSRLKASLGYARAEAQGCDSKATVGSPCYGYIQPTATGSIYWQALSDVFVDSSIQNSSSDPFRAGDVDAFSDASKGFYSTTATHVQYSYAVGANLLQTASGACSTLLVTTSNRTSGIDEISNSPNQSRFANTASIDLIPGPYWPTFLAAYSRVGYIQASVPMQTLFVFRVQYGLLPTTSYNATKRKCQ